MTPKWLERQIDEALLLVATQAAVLYAQRRARRVIPRVVIGGAVLTGVGAAVGAAAVGLGAVGVAGGALAWYKQRAKGREAGTPAFDTNWRPPSATGTSPATAVGSPAADGPRTSAESESSTTS
jgi:hypothetical protein